MNKIFLVATLMLTFNSYADWDIESKKIFIKATNKIYKLSGKKLELKSGFKKDSFEKQYINTLLKSTKSKLSKSKKIKFGKLTATVLATKKSVLDFDCKNYDELTDCLYGSYDKLIFVIHTRSNELFAIGHSNMLDFDTNRFGNTGVEQEMLIFKGKEKYIAKQANW
jgi:hypothetical protein